MKVLMAFLLISIPFLGSCSGCTSQGNDTDNDGFVLPDKDTSISQDNEQDDLSVDDSSDIDNESDVEEPSDNDPDVEPWETDGDPYADMDTIYEYYGDYDPDVKDPENVRDLWKQIYHYGEKKPVDCVPKPYDACWQNLPFEPVIIEDVDDPYYGDKLPELTALKCDKLLTQEEAWKHSWTHNSENNWNHSNGNVFFSMRSPRTYFRESNGTYLYNLEKHQILRFGYSYMNGWFDGRYVFMNSWNWSENHEFPDDEETYESYKDYLVYYDTVENKYGYAWKGELYNGKYLRSNGEYILYSLRTPDNKKYRVMYTKIGEWESWKELKAFIDEPIYDNVAYLPHMKGSHVLFFNCFNQLVRCDLSVGDESCVQISREGEVSVGGLMGENNKIYYKQIEDLQNEEPKHFYTRLIEADVSDPKNIKYEVLYENDATPTGGIGALSFILDINKDFLLYSKTVDIDEEHMSVHVPNLCFLRLIDKKHFCMDEKRNGKHYEMYNGYMWKDKYVVFNYWNDIIVRDMQCYCEEYPENCPFEK